MINPRATWIGALLVIRALERGADAQLHDTLLVAGGRLLHASDGMIRAAQRQAVPHAGIPRA